ncbi:MAG TPA: HD domain-containing protein, partial [Aquifex aeolicus]|nr:HD domain-containing protein [Aquifex aeolicus]
DPVRILRGFRLSIEKNLTLTEDFYEFVKENPKLVLKSPIERITQELFKIMKEKTSHRVIRELYQYGIFEAIFPEFKRLKEIKDQGENHIYPLDEHTLKTLEFLEDVIENRAKYLSRELLKDFGKKRVLGEFTDVELLKLGALFHDIGKPETFKIRDGKITFYDHDKVGANIVKEIGRRLKWGEEATEFISKLVRHHLRPFYLREAFKKGQLKRKGMANFWKDCEDIAPHLFLLSIADALASGDNEEDVKALIETISELEGFRENELNKEFLKPILSGNEIMEILKIKPGKMVGILKKSLEEAQLEGKVKTKEEAIEFVKEKYKELQKK